MVLVSGIRDKIILYRETKTKTFEEEKRIMKTRKVMALAGAGVLAVSMMTGCGSSSSTASTTAATTTAAAAETAKEAVTTAAEKKTQILQDRSQRQVLPH